MGWFNAENLEFLRQLAVKLLQLLQSLLTKDTTQL